MGYVRGGGGKEKRGRRTVHSFEDALDGAGAAGAGHCDVEVVVMRGG